MSQIHNLEKILIGLQQFCKKTQKQRIVCSPNSAIATRQSTKQERVGVSVIMSDV